jgi:hypothetical protein
VKVGLLCQDASTRNDRLLLVGMNTTAGSYALLKSVVPGDAAVAAKLRKAGAILLGKANLVIRPLLTNIYRRINT